ncbi:MAG TPA: DUF4350 domain-containing protein [Candidatus Micrarchaeia archaeon]|nr:DUF4350 domain-containing protein [Candidatus Micrarchaeia archaeon]
MRAWRSSRGAPLLWIVGLVGALAVLLLAIAPAAVSPPGDRSSFANGPSGTLALANLLTAHGDRVDRLTGSGFPAALRSTPALVEAGPSHPFSARDRAALVRFVAGGGTLLYAAAIPAVDRPALAAFGVALDPSVRAPAAWPLLPVLPGGAGAVTLGRARRLTGASPAVLALLGGPGGAVAVARPLGRGHLYVLGSAAALDNAGLRRGGNAALVLGLLALAHGRRVVIDEIHHGYVAGTGVGALVLGTSLGAALLLVLAALLVAGATQGRRLGRPLPPPELAIVRSTADHLRAVAALYARTRDRGVVAGRVRAQLEEVVRGVTGCPPQAGDDVLAGALAALHPREAPAVLGVLRALAAAERGTCPVGRLLELARSADGLARRLGGPLAPARSGEPAPARARPLGGPGGGWG